MAANDFFWNERVAAYDGNGVNKTMIISELRRRLEAEVGSESLIFPDDDRYEIARFGYNLMYDRRPAAIVRTLNVNALRRVLQISRQMDLRVAIRGGGHHIGGFSTIDDGILIDFSIFRDIRFDEHTDIVSVQPGVRLGDIDARLARFGRCLPGGTVSDTGITGLTLGGGIGWLVGIAGLTCDYLQSATLLLHNGKLIEVTDATEPHLMAALRGGGMGGFGIILELKYRTIPMPRLVAGSIPFSNSDAINALNAIGASHAVEEYSALSIAPTLRRCSDGINMSVDLCLAGEHDQELFRLQKAIGGDWSNISEVQYTEWQSRFDEDFLPPRRGYWTSTHFASARQDFDTLASIIDAAPSGGCTALIEFYNRKILQRHARNSFYPLRSSAVGVLLTARWVEVENDPKFIDWARSSAAVLRQGDTTGGYSNYSNDGDKSVVSGYQKEVLDVMFDLGEKFDPHYTFGLGHRQRIFRGESA